MTSTDIYGFEDDDLEGTRRILESVFALKIEARNSLYFGDYFIGITSGTQMLKLQRNLDPLHDPKDSPEERRLAPEHPSSALLVYVSGSDLDSIRRMMEERIADIVFLRRDTVS